MKKLINIDFSEYFKNLMKYISIKFLHYNIKKILLNLISSLNKNKILIRHEIIKTKCLIFSLNFSSLST